jgi:predicted nucleic acid-binding protein
MRARVLDAGPLLFLARLGRLDLLLLGADQIYVPVAVLAEIRRKPDPALEPIQAVLKTWLTECPLINPDLLKLLPDLGAGEREVIIQALERKVTSVVMDDLDARRVARRLGLEPIGTVGLLLAAKKRGIILSLKAELDRLAGMGFWISQALRTEALKEAGEEEG